MSDWPIRYFNGDIVMDVNDLASAVGTGWGHRRTYSNQLDHDYGNGYNWMVESWPHLI
jgi:hypothetical protein